MNEVIHKFIAKRDGAVYLPDDAQVLAYRFQNDTFCVWAIVDPEKESSPYGEAEFRLWPTGVVLSKQLFDDYRHVKTYFINEEVWHLFRYSVDTFVGGG